MKPWAGGMTDSDRRVSYGNEVPRVAMLELRKQDKQHCSLPLKHGNSLSLAHQKRLSHAHMHMCTLFFSLSLSQPGACKRHVPSSHALLSSSRSLQSMCSVAVAYLSCTRRFHNLPFRFPWQTNCYWHRLSFKVRINRYQLS